MTTRTIALLTAAIAAAVLVAGLTIGWNLQPRADTSPRPAPPATTTTSPTPTYDPGAGDAAEHDQDSPPDEAAWAPAVDNFATNFTHTAGGSAKWRQRLIGTSPRRPYVTTEVAEQLSTVDIRNVPTGHYQNREVIKSSAYDLAVKIDYREGWSLVLWLITDGSRFQIYAYDRWEE